MWLVSIERDVTERKRVAEALRREHEFNRRILDTIQNVVLVLDPEGRILQFNSYLEKISGWKFEEVRGRDWFETFIPTTDQKISRRRFDVSSVGVVEPAQ